MKPRFTLIDLLTLGVLFYAIALPAIHLAQNGLNVHSVFTAACYPVTIVATYLGLMYLAARTYSFFSKNSGSHRDRKGQDLDISQK